LSIVILGEACSQPVESGYWLALNATGILPPIPRTSHAAMADQSGKMWVIGGETFSHSKYMVSTLTPDLKNDDVQVRYSTNPASLCLSEKFEHFLDSLLASL
jgi:hypothetical protein